MIRAGTGTTETAGAMASASAGVAAATLAVASAACCVSPVVAPVIVGVLGAGGAVWAAGLKPYAWWILGGALICLVAGFWMVYRPRASCAAEALPRSRRIMQAVAKVSLWFGAVCWLAAAALQVTLPS